MSCLWQRNRAAACLLALLLVCPPVRAADKPADMEKTLRQQYRDACQAVVKALLDQPKGPDRLAPVGLAVLEPWRRLFLAELDPGAKPADRLALCDEFARRVKEAREMNEALREAGRISASEYALTRAACLEDEILILRERLQAKEDKEGAEKLRKLRLERREAYQGALLALDEESKAGRGDPLAMLEATRLSLHADLATDEKPEARVALRQATVDRLAKMVEVAKARLEAGRIDPAEHAAVRVARLTAEIDLQREKSGPRAERLATYQRLLRERRDAAREMLRARQAQFEAGRGTYDKVLDASLAVLEAELPLAEKPADRLALQRARLEIVKKGEELIKAQFEAARASALDRELIRSFRLEAEINLLRAERAAK